MEESFQRRERLKAMRLEASQVGATNNDVEERSTSLSNPFVESTTNPESQVQSFSQSFNYYTNPMAAYSGNNNKQVNHQTSQNYPSTPQSSTGPQMKEAYHINPQGMQQPYAARPGLSSYSNSRHPGGARSHFGSGPGPNPGLGSGLGYGRGQWFRNSGPRGRGRGNNNNHHVSAEDEPHRFLNKSMVEDPWKFLEPVIWKSQKKQWLPHSLVAKKPRVSESTSTCHLNLAQILAASFKNDE